MLKIRDYQKSDAEYIASWCENKTVFHMWCADQYGTYPITGDDINTYYDGKGKNQGYKLTAFDENGIVGHFTVRMLRDQNNVARIGFVIINNERRGQGFGKEMIRLALDYARKKLNAEKATLEVFEDNQAAYNCYKSVGFKETDPKKTEIYDILGEKWVCRELEYEF